MITHGLDCHAEDVHVTNRSVVRRRRAITKPVFTDDAGTGGDSSVVHTQNDAGVDARMCNGEESGVDRTHTRPAVQRQADRESGEVGGTTTLPR